MLPSVYSNKILHTVNNFVQLTRICDCKRSITIEVVFYSTFPSCCGKCFWDFRQAVQQDVCLLEGFLCESWWKSGKGTTVGWDNKWLPWPCLLALWAVFPLCSHLLVSHSNPNLYPCHPPIPLCFPHLHPELQWAKIEHTNYSPVVPKIANDCLCVCMCVWGGSAGGPVFASALPWQPALLVSVSPSSSNVSFH